MSSSSTFQSLTKIFQVEENGGTGKPQRPVRRPPLSSGISIITRRPLATEGGRDTKKNVKIPLPIKRNGSSTSGTLKQPLAIGGNNNKRMQFSMAKFNRATN